MFFLFCFLEENAWRRKREYSRASLAAEGKRSARDLLAGGLGVILSRIRITCNFSLLFFATCHTPTAIHLAPSFPSPVFLLSFCSLFVSSISCILPLASSDSVSFSVKFCLRRRWCGQFQLQSASARIIPYNNQPWLRNKCDNGE